MKLELDSMQGGLSVEKTSNCMILRHIYIWSIDNKRTLLRIYEFKTKTIVIASQLNGAIILEEYLISKVIRDFKLNTDNLIWICHIGLFSDFRPTEEKFLHTIFQWKKEFIFGQKNSEYIKTEEIDLTEVEKRIECNLEPVEKWLGLDPIIQKKRQKELQKQKHKLLNLHWQNKLIFLFKQKQIQELLSQALVGAFFFYPELKEDSSSHIKFVTHKDLRQSNYQHEKLALPYLVKYHPDKEIVICISTKDHYCHCTILEKQSLLISA